MTTIAVISLPVDEFALGETVDQLSTVSVRVESVIAEGPARTVPFVWFSGVDRDELETALEADSTVAAYTHLLASSAGDAGADATSEVTETAEANAEPTDWFYQLRYGEGVRSVCSSIYEGDGAVLDAQITDNRWTLRLLFPEREDLSDAVAAIESQDESVRVDVQRLVEAGDDEIETTASLTDPQREAIAEAYRQGYYDVPREISLEELACELDISHQALSERLRRANRVLAGEQLDDPTGEVAME
ncbi:helix-turn-helix domain-containing protein [Natrialba asiatica]|uniref:Bacterio-opsin activator HTH domain-containing protein n=1 Tax=Natrialba asiatica (strain ATCC 700177 / DSM 12278 / JCM 9576 / FERM P-10747 / NBRC 102637 / 172P1) TaxID=29540 RepID=M0AU18_NATA1|nr:helix-turn-helix domain-containing protein [Natrialba asiatica]ELZ02025.1 Bacterio-opsin activator HTH domain-containing protein [Natrialba asiatica DSM 12278]